jgi:hypothetical protein
MTEESQGGGTKAPTIPRSFVTLRMTKEKGENIELSF